MKIAVCMYEFPKLSEKFILYQIKNLIDLGHELHIYAFLRSQEKTAHPEVVSYDLLSKTTFLHEGLPSRRSLRGLKAVAAILRYMLFHPRKAFRCFQDRNTPAFSDKIKNLSILERFADKHFDVIHCHFGTVAAQLIFLKKVFPSIKFVTTFHGFDIRLGLEKGGHIYGELFQSADNIIAICSYNREQLKVMGCPEDKLYDHHNGIDINKFRPAPRKLATDCRIITTVARLVQEKNILFALLVIKALKEQSSCHFKYHLIGTGALKNEIQNRILELNIANDVIMFGELSSDEVVKRLQESDVFFLPSHAEALPTVLLEAQAVGVPVVATKVGGVSEALIPGVSGYLVPNNDLKEAVFRIGALLGQQDLREQFSQAARKFIEDNFDISKLNRRLLELYQVQ